MNNSSIFRLISTVSLFVFLLLLMSCSRHLRPEMQRVNEQRVPEFSLNQEITIINMQPSTEEISIVAGMNTYKVNLKELTDEAVKLLNLELQKRGASLSPDAEKVIKLSVTEAKFIPGGFRLGYDVNLHAETGDGYGANYYVENRSGGGVARASGGAITLAITELFNDEKIIGYLE